MHYYTYIKCMLFVHSILATSAFITKCSEKKEFIFPQSILNKEEKSPPTAEKLNELFKSTTRSSEKTPPKKHIFHNYEHVRNPNVNNPNANKQNKFYFRETISDPNKPGFTNYYQSNYHQPKAENQSSDIPKNAIFYFNFSDINTQESYEKEASKFAQGENTQVCIQCDRCNHTENNFFWMAAYHIIAHRKTEHSICGCNKPHPTPKDAYDCALCRQKY
jgi:hypothetical protein